MDLNSLNLGCGLIATAPLFAGHMVFIHELRYTLLAWFCSFVCTVLMIFVSLSSLFTSNPWFILLYGIPFDALGKILLKFFSAKFPFLQNGIAKASLGMACGLGFALSHVLTLYLPMVFNQPYSADFHPDWPNYYPDSLDLAISNHFISFEHMGISLVLFRFYDVNIFIMYFVVFAVEYGFGALTQIPIIWLKQVILGILSYSLFAFGLLSFRTYNPSKDLEVQLNDMK